MDSTIPPPAPGWPTRKSRRRVGLFVGAFVGLQLLIPLSHLLAGDPEDSRFTWRTWPAPFEGDPSSCKLDAWREHGDGTREAVELARMVHADWLAEATHNEDVIEALLRKQCDEKGVVGAELIQRCASDEEPQDFQLRCASGQLQSLARTASR
jgi:hypothetical protein